jgi:hypothetical protein
VRFALSILLLAALSAAEVPVFEERRVELRGQWQRETEGFTLRFTPPPADFRVHVRLVLRDVPPSAAVRLNGSRLTPLAGYPGHYDVSDFLVPKLNTLILESASPPRDAALLVTPRVFISSQTVDRDAGGLRVVTSVRNTLENTVNVTLWISVPLVGRASAELSADGTVPPGTTVDVTARGGVAVSSLHPTVAITTLLEKAEEAMEGAYRFRR